MKKLLFVLPILFLEGCFWVYTMGERRDYVHYSVEIPSEARNITLYIPFPHYKGKPDMRVLKWIKEEFAEDQRIFKSKKDEKVDLVDTEYGKMLYLYLPKSPGGFVTDSGAGIMMERRVNPKKVSQDYKLTGEDKVEAETISEKDIVEYVKKGVIGNKGKEICQKINLPIYVQFEGEKLKIKFHYSIKEDVYAPLFESIKAPFWTMRPTTWLLLCYIIYGDEYITFTKSGWQLMPIEKTILKDASLKW